MKRFKFGWIYLLLLIFVLLIQFFGVLQNAENSTQDALFQTGRKVSSKIYIIGIDEETLDHYGPFDTWSREKMADLVSLLSADEKNAPAVIGIDVGYFGKKDPVVDDKLVAAVRKAGNVVLTSTATFGNVAGQGNQIVLLEEPFEELKEAAAASGHANVQMDPDGVVRHAMGSLPYQGQSIRSFDTHILEQYLQYKGETFTENSPGAFSLTKPSYYIPYAGKPRAYYGSIGAGCSFYKVLEGTYPTQAFRGSIVLVGAYASGTQDNYYSAIDKDTQMYGVEIHANIVNQLIDDEQKTELPSMMRLLVTLALGILSIIAVSFLPTGWAISVVLALTGGYIGLVKLLYQSADVLLPILYPAIAAVLILIAFILIRYLVIHREKQRIISNYGKYLSPEIARSIADIGEENLSLGGIKKDIAVLFVDIRSFTTLSESLPPERVFEMLNQYLTITTKAIFDQKGTVDKFIGDATMGVFNAPLDLEDYTYRAVMAGLEMVELSKHLDEKLPEDLRGRVAFGVGINCGEAVVGNIGTDFRMEYTAIGDTVNTASRLEGQAKGGTVIVSEAVMNRVSDRIEFESMGSVKLKGKADEVNIYRAVAPKDATAFLNPSN